MGIPRFIGGRFNKEFLESLTPISSSFLGRHLSKVELVCIGSEASSYVFLFLAIIHIWINKLLVG